MILIADSGASKGDWCVVDALDVVSRFKTPGLHILTKTTDEIKDFLLAEVMPRVPEVASVKKIYFYGAGCLDSMCAKVAKAFENVFPHSRVEVNSDLLGAARSLCGSQPGIACILGTGSNTCFYDGNHIALQVPSLGYILGDEGSGAVLGRLLISDVFKRQLPERLCKDFLSEYQLDVNTVIDKVYREPGANRFLASVTPFLLKHIEEPAIHRLVLNNFKQFFIRNVASYPDYRNILVNVTGSIGWFFRDVLKEASEAMDCTLGRITVSPMDGLIEYHCRKG